MVDPALDPVVGAVDVTDTAETAGEIVGDVAGDAAVGWEGSLARDGALMGPSHHEAGRGVRRVSPQPRATSSRGLRDVAAARVAVGCGARGATGPDLHPVSTDPMTLVGAVGQGAAPW